MKILVMNGPNLNLLGEREPGIYGTGTLADLEQMMRDHVKDADVDLEFFQSNHEGVLIDKLHQSRFDFDGVVYNPGAHTHYSYALHDAVAAIRTPVIEVHISDIETREEFRRISVIAPACIGQVKGLGLPGYNVALDQLLAYIREQGR